MRQPFRCCRSRWRRHRRWLRPDYRWLCRPSMPPQPTTGRRPRSIARPEPSRRWYRHRRPPGCPGHWRSYCCPRWWRWSCSLLNFDQPRWRKRRSPARFDQSQLPPLQSHSRFARPPKSCRRWRSNRGQAPYRWKASGCLKPPQPRSYPLPCHWHCRPA